MQHDLSITILNMLITIGISLTTVYLSEKYDKHKEKNNKLLKIYNAFIEKLEILSNYLIYETCYEACINLDLPKQKLKEFYNKKVLDLNFKRDLLQLLTSLLFPC